MEDLKEQKAKLRLQYSSSMYTSTLLMWLLVAPPGERAQVLAGGGGRRAAGARGGAGGQRGAPGGADRAARGSRGPAGGQPEEGGRPGGGAPVPAGGGGGARGPLARDVSSIQVSRASQKTLTQTFEPVFVCASRSAHLTRLKRTEEGWPGISANCLRGGHPSISHVRY
eukprot:1057628-Prorocentrum_minimum.AAC.1